MFQEADLFGLYQLGFLSSSFCAVLANRGHQYDKREGEEEVRIYFPPVSFLIPLNWKWILFSP